mmetsp:Transcript_45098/g.109117  ORF Transcript_45098/g.109117 Transcript_45098/m.109117 type:complete len:644 (+) Transcript_45098:156-2087(+)|eukprot:CAMPEP_0113617734 /NCGR_PEP_ID=MMETSP0017_2-20120614/8946_1 /TAXON_ID=2856 /ORGANISM="Cylindrotheca closterium" /LENGTH=643 /DNA_ID=CAMNT_0000527165 /DNA_START=156 /DNA_END=2087 /DNA_ORIENTATION=+ /assembly_acc=CAM_ASM_000147
MPQQKEEAQPFKVALSTKFVVSSITASCALAFGMGRMAKMSLTTPITMPRKNEAQIDMPTPIALKGKEIPETIYTAKNFDTRKSATIFSQWLQQDPDSVGNVPEPINERLNETHDDEDEEEHLPAGQHLLVDIDGIEADFLNSEERLATAMVDLVNDSGLTLLSYHCHGLSPAGVSCAGVLLESHVSFHTWPAEGVITLDLFTCGCTSLLDSMKLIERLFAIPRNGPDGDQPTVLWAYKRRGFKDQISDLPHNKPGSPRDTFAYPIGIHGMDYKKDVASAELAPNKHAYVYDYIQRPHQNTASYMKSISNDGSYESKNPELFSPNRLFYYNGVFKSSSLGNSEAFESFVHPAMMAHPDPKEVLIYGSATGAALREVLKHNTVTSVTMVRVDSGLMEFARQYLPSWNDCSNFGLAKNCFDDARVKFVDAVAPGSKFDVIVVDTDFFDGVHNQEYLEGLVTSLSEQGVAAFHVTKDRPADMAMVLPHGSKASALDTKRTDFMTELEGAGFAETKQYNEKQVGFPEPRNYVVAFKGGALNWGLNEAQINREIVRRTAVTTVGVSSLQFIDGAKMATYSQFANGKGGLDCSTSSPSEQVCANSGAAYEPRDTNNTGGDKQCGGSPEMPACKHAEYLQQHVAATVVVS